MLKVILKRFKLASLSIYPFYQSFGHLQRRFLRLLFDQEYQIEYFNFFSYLMKFPSMKLHYRSIFCQLLQNVFKDLKNSRLLWSHQIVTVRKNDFFFLFWSTKILKSQ